MYIELHVKYTLFLSDFLILTIFEVPRHISKNYSNAKFHENPSTGSRVVPFRQMDGQAERNDEVNSSFSQLRQRI